MKRKNLEKIIVLGLLLSSSMYGTAWAKVIPEDWKPMVEGDKLILNDVKETIKNSDDYTYKGKKISEFDKVEVFFEAQEAGKRPIGVYSERFDWGDTDLTVHVNGNYSNNDALHFTNFSPYINLKSLTIDMQAKGSDAINLSRDIKGNANVYLACDLNATVKDGNGIRANASKWDDGIVYEAKIIVDGNAYIQLDADAGNYLSAYFNGSAINPTAVWAGSDANYVTESQKAYGKGEVYLKGNTIIQLNGKGTDGTFFNSGRVYGISAGKNGYIEVNNLQITGEKEYTYGISASEINITYNGVDNTENRQGTQVVLNGNWNKITMNGDNSYAIYAQGKGINGNSNTVRSGDNGIGGLNVKGNILAEDNGAIDLTIHNDQFSDEDNKINTNNVTVEGDILAKSAGNVNMAVKNMANIKGNIEAVGVNSAINIGSISAADGQSIMRANDSGSTSINITGNVQAANGAKIDLSLGDGATFTGRIDDYIDAANKELWNKIDHNSLFDKDFVNNNDVDGSGSVNLTLGNGSKWDVTAQSWVTNIDADNSIIDLTEGGNGNHAVHIGDLNGNATFIVNLDPDTEAKVNNGNMIYVYNGEDAKNLNLRIKNETEVLTSLADGEKLRFATVAKKGGGFADTYVARGRGVINSGFSIAYEDYDVAKKDENYKYNGGEDFDASKPGSNYVDSIYENGENVYLVRDTSKDAGKSDSGATIINMSRANYKNAIYMDRLNKRMGEMRYVDGEEEQGLWVRLRHDRIGQSGDFRSMNTMYELGYDVKQPASSGEHRIGMAIDYMDGSTTYDDILGKGETKRYGLWLYDTWLGEKGHYTDYIVKWGHLSNEFDIRDKDSFEHIVGDYSNNVFSVSAEYGKKNDMGNNWYFEPQAQLQLARVTGADYVTTQGSKVSVDGINSLIGRAGFRIGRDMNENSTVYLKADLLHEFMGDQTVTAADATGTLREEFDNKGTWYDVGFGFAAKMSKDSYAFLDFERSFGNDNDETYQINAGLQWSF